MNPFPNPFHMRSLVKFCCLLATLLPAHIALAQSGWTDLFHGENLDGWTERNQRGSFHVEDGAIVGTATSGLGTTFLCSNEEYGDFDLVFECKLIDPELNSGVQIRSRIRTLPGKDTANLVLKRPVEHVEGDDLDTELTQSWQ